MACAATSVDSGRTVVRVLVTSKMLDEVLCWPSTVMVTTWIEGWTESKVEVRAGTTTSLVG